MLKLQGEVIKLIRHRGYGFIKPDGEDEDLFFHHSALENVQFEDLKDGDILSFEIEQTDKGPQATGIMLVTDDDAADTPVDDFSEDFGSEVMDEDEEFDEDFDDEFDDDYDDDLEDDYELDDFDLDDDDEDII